MIKLPTIYKTPLQPHKERYHVYCEDECDADS